MSHLPIVWLVGGSGKLGQTIAGLLEPNYQVISLSRTACKANTHHFIHYPVDLSQPLVALPDLLTHHLPRAIVFCQRYRPASQFDMSIACNTEILSTQQILEESCAKATSPLSVVIISSVNAFLINPHLSFWYHWLKASQIQLMKYYSVRKSASTFHINCIAPGSFLKDTIENYPPSHRSFFELLQEWSAKNVCTVQNIAHLVEYLISDKAACINGQTITLDGGLTNRLQEELIHTYDQQKRPL
ncbi:MAG: SDR family oxidoreductase [Chlamydiia bacterium]|nr:SDR family oxidoreductase [Chlamydiia bacterium]